MKLRVGTKASIDNVVLSNWSVGFDVEHDEGIGYVADGSLKVTNVKFDNVETKSKGKKTSPGKDDAGNDIPGESVDVSAIYTENEAATGAGNGTDMQHGQKVGLLVYNRRYASKQVKS